MPEPMAHAADSSHLGIWIYAHSRFHWAPGTHTYRTLALMQGGLRVAHFARPIHCIGVDRGVCTRQPLHTRIQSSGDRRTLGTSQKRRFTTCSLRWETHAVTIRWDGNGQALTGSGNFDHPPRWFYRGMFQTTSGSFNVEPHPDPGRLPATINRL